MFLNLKTKACGWEVGMAGVAGTGRGKMETTVLENNKKCEKNKTCEKQ